MKKPKNVFFITDPIFCQDFMIVYTKTHAKYRKILKQVLNIEIDKDDKCSGCFQTINNKKKGDLGIIWISNKQSNLIHEIFHAVSWIMRNRAIHLDSEGSEETWAYYISYLYREIKEKLNAKKSIR